MEEGKGGKRQVQVRTPRPLPSLRHHAVLTSCPYSVRSAALEHGWMAVLVLDLTGRAQDLTILECVNKKVAWISSREQEQVDLKESGIRRTWSYNQKEE